MKTGRLHVAGGAVKADDIAQRIESALARIEAARAIDSDVTARLRVLQHVVETSVSDLDALLAAGKR